MPERIVGKVAQINSDRELVINRGSNDGVTEGDYFYIKGRPTIIKDPDTEEVLGEIAPTKAVVRVRQVAERFCIARTFRTQEVMVAEAIEGNAAFGTLLNPLGDLLQPPRAAKYETKVETLRLDPSKGKPIDSTESAVSVGDIAETLLPGEDKDPATATLFT